MSEPRFGRWTAAADRPPAVSHGVYSSRDRIVIAEQRGFVMAVLYCAGRSNLAEGWYGLGHPRTILTPPDHWTPLPQPPPQSDQWVSADTTPQTRNDVYCMDIANLVVHGGRSVYPLDYDGGRRGRAAGWYSGEEAALARPSHWMPLPAFPTERADMSNGGDA